MYGCTVFTFINISPQIFGGKIKLCKSNCNVCLNGIMKHFFINRIIMT